jgi:hypothetical protein
MAGGPWQRWHSGRTYGGGVAKKLKQINEKWPQTGQNQASLLRCKISLAFFVRCNILPVVRAVELRKVQANSNGAPPLSGRAEGSDR